MQQLTLNEIKEATGGELVRAAGVELALTGITTDSRKAGDGILFVPLAGERFDGHDFIDGAFEAGSPAALTHKDDIAAPPGRAIVRVADTKRALGDIARYYKRKYNVPTASVTGSVGKTTTKDLMCAVLSERYKTLKTPNNFNNDIGVPLTIFGLEKEHEAAVIELGMNHFGEIEYLASIAEPDVAVITNIGMSHIENLGSQEGIFKAKMEIAERFTEKNTLIVNGDDKFLKTVTSDKYRVIRFGLDKSNDVYAEDIISKGLSGIEFTVVNGKDRFKAEVTLPGIHNVYNALAAVCTGMCFGLSADECAAGLRNCEYTSSRLEIIEHKGIEVINDCYNSSPSSVRAALDVQKNTSQKRRVAILGDVLEMGEFAAKAHYEMGTYVAVCGTDALVTVGENARHIAEGAAAAGMEDIVSYGDTDAAVKDIEKLVCPGDSVLVKASHGMDFYKITEAIKGM